MRKTITALALLLSTTTFAQEIINLAKEMKCSDAQSVMNYFVDIHKEKPVWVGKSVHNTHITLLMNRPTNGWKISVTIQIVTFVLVVTEDQINHSEKSLSLVQTWPAATVQVLQSLL